MGGPLMCTGLPARVLHSGAEVAEVEVDGRVRLVSLAVLDEAVTDGEWLLIHAGVALRRLTDDDARLLQLVRGERR
ncbi:MAG: HypC/HybG/HupF family hydrogenase formation chaperone [Hamadaea sp.]|uniref:HypC/HybG/HupF family hydrogenase formation chaperone n=1 Tax=Hamadaea sp. TaxID=2024425 RepID=UPI0017F018D7|nr:HypC/HybG/HupF family hydrogenase formation chaperone [Hamadaea sp.]NUT18848.1 HypC/HybG/HupF family hydrogenase formation chaperone [Hamadaea sp.]